MQTAQTLRDLKYMLEIPSANPKVARFLQNLLFVHPKQHSQGGMDNSLAILVDAGLLPAEGNGTPPLHVSDYTGEGGKVDQAMRQRQSQRGLLSRLKMALFGGVIVVAPMLIMTLHQDQLTALLTASLFVLVVAVVLAWFMKDAAEKDILTATAAYAAILVVFVGTTVTPT